MKNIQKIKMIVTDLDKTLLRSDKTISDYTANIFEKCRTQGIKIAVATARSVKSSSRVISQIMPDAIVASNGVSVFKGNQEIYRRVIANDIANQIISECVSDRQISAVYVSGDNISLRNVIPKDIDPDYAHYTYDNFSRPIDADIHKITVEAMNPEAVKNMADRYPMCSALGYSNENWYAFFNREASKENGVKALAEKFGIDMSCVVAFGDDYNDLGMIRECGIGVAMADAIDEAKAAADYICDTSDNDGVAKWLEEMEII